MEGNINLTDNHLIITFNSVYISELTKVFEKIQLYVFGLLYLIARLPISIKLTRVIEKKITAATRAWS